MLWCSGYASVLAAALSEVVRVGWPSSEIQLALRVLPLCRSHEYLAFYFPRYKRRLCTSEPLVTSGAAPNDGEMSRRGALPRRDLSLACPSPGAAFSAPRMLQQAWTRPSKADSPSPPSYMQRPKTLEAAPPLARNEAGKDDLLQQLIATVWALPPPV